jgi:hypothetical protein
MPAIGGTPLAKIFWPEARGQECSNDHARACQNSDSPRGRAVDLGECFDDFEVRNRVCLIAASLFGTDEAEQPRFT